MAELDPETKRLAKVVDHPIRSKIIRLLGERGSLGWKELSTDLGVKTGALYHHLDTLEGFVQRDAAKKYGLTKQGRILYSKISESHTIDAVQQAAIEIKSEGTGARRLASIFVPRVFLDYLTSSDTLAVLAFVFVSMSFTVLSVWTHSSPELYFVHHDPEIIETFGDYFVSLGLVVLVCYVASKGIYKSGLDLVSMAAVSAFSFVPVFAISLLTLVPSVEAFFVSSSVSYTLILVFFQAWSSALLGAGLSVVSGIRIERTLPVGLFILYSTMVLMLLQGVGP